MNKNRMGGEPNFTFFIERHFFYVYILKLWYIIKTSIKQDIESKRN